MDDYKWQPKDVWKPWAGHKKSQDVPTFTQRFFVSEIDGFCRDAHQRSESFTRLEVSVLMSCSLEKSFWAKHCQLSGTVESRSASCIVSELWRPSILLIPQQVNQKKNVTVSMNMLPIGTIRDRKFRMSTATSWTTCPRIAPITMPVAFVTNCLAVLCQRSMAPLIAGRRREENLRGEILCGWMLGRDWVGYCWMDAGKG